MKVFISQPMNGRKEEEILKVRKRICDMFHITDDELIESYVKHVPDFVTNEGVWCLGDSISILSTADIVIFAPGWEEARGCLIEHKICEEYGIPFTEVPKGQSFIVSLQLT